MLRLILLLILPVFLIGCVSTRTYTDLAVDNAIAQARLEAAEQARLADRDRLQEIREAIRLWIEQMGNVEGRRPHRPGGA